ncbi:MAG: metallophosphoesterase [Chloroflexota bacterium]|nr:metallophosphoesterase [Chloroflexota bacterium]
MKRVAWATDLHLEFTTSMSETNILCESIIAQEAEALLIGGDTGTAHSLRRYLRILEERLQLPIYFVLGNHDCYGGSIKEMRSVAVSLAQNSRWLQWLPLEGCVRLAPNTGLVGHGAWADGRLGNGVNSQVLLNDFVYIQGLTGLSSEKLFTKLNNLGDQAAEYFRKILPQALDRYRNLLLLTHVPPFEEACWHKGRISDDEFLPHFTCQAVGEVLIDMMQSHPGCNLTVLCGHTHGNGTAQILPNLLVKTGGAEYGQPALQEVILVGQGTEDPPAFAKESGRVD